MKLLIAGSRNILDYNLIKNNIKNPENIEYIISGCASGIDTLAIEYARNNNIKCIQCPANWKQFGRKAGYMRNEHMVSIADYALIIWDGKSAGTRHTLNLCIKNKVPYKLVKLV